jgi:hypothetical protein
MLIRVRLSSKFYNVASDSQLWKKAYYERFVRPRASRTRGTPYSQLSYSSKLSNWLDEENLVKRGNDTNWKKQYKLRHNWSRGACDVFEIPIADERPLPPLLISLHDGVVYTADIISGLRAWSSKNNKRLLARINHNSSVSPTSLAIDAAAERQRHRIVVGFRDGSFTIFSFDKINNTFEIEHQHQPSSNGMLLEMACHYPFLVTMTASQLFSIYKLSEDETQKKLHPPLLLHSLRGQSIFSPLSLSIRPLTDTIVATIAYSIPTFFHWAVGIQELRFNSETGDLLYSRIATSPSGSGLTLGSTLSPATSSPPTRASSPFPATGAFVGAAPGYSKPTSLSYTHPYLLLSHPDNTLTTFLVTSTAEVLKISVGTRLWGHTSSVSGAHVEGRGKAVSVTERGEEMRIWELEGSAGRKTGLMRSSLGGTGSVKVTPGKRTRHSRDESNENEADDQGVIRGWVGFDDDSVVVLKERIVGKQDLLVYDFS